MRLRTILVAIGLLAVASTAFSATITVRRDGSGDFTTIQPALDAASPGDTIDIGPGEYTEFRTIRPPNWNWDIEVYAYVTVDDLTLIGAGADRTLIGPTTPQYNNYTFSPKSIWAGGLDSIEVNGLSVRHCYDGIYGPQATLLVSHFVSLRNRVGISNWSPDSRVENSDFVGIGAFPTGIAHFSECTHARVTGCTFRTARLYFQHVENYFVENCNFVGGIEGIGIYAQSTGVITDCSINDIEIAGVVVEASSCTLRNTEISGGAIGIDANCLDLRASAVSIRNTELACVRVWSPSQLQLNDSDLVPAGGFGVQCVSTMGPPPHTYDFTNNYWGVTDSTAIAELVWDGNDSASIDEYIDFVPFAGGPVPTEPTTWGAVKSLFR